MLASQGLVHRGASPDSNVESRFGKKGPLYAGARHVSSIRLVFRLFAFLSDPSTQTREAWFANPVSEMETVVVRAFVLKS